jgi:hypothetical protein
MLYLLLAVAICLLVPWLIVLLCRRMPRRPPDPLPEGQLNQLAAQLRSGKSHNQAEVIAVEDRPFRTDLTQPPAAALEVAQGKDDELKGDAELAQTSTHGTRLTVSKPATPELRARSYGWVTVVFLPIFIVGGLTLTAGWAILFHYLGEAHARSFPPAEFTFKPSSYGTIMGLPAAFLGIFSALPLVGSLQRLILGRRRYLEYLHWDEGRFQSGGKSMEGLMLLLLLVALVFSVVSVIIIIMGMNWYARFAEDQIAIKRPYNFGEEVHSYDSIEQIVVTSHRQVGKEIRRGADLGIRFSDGRSWKTDTTFYMPRDEAECDRLIEFLQRKTGKPITRARLLEDVPGWRREPLVPL